jgi:lysophospholipase L1-like esterase
MIFISKISIEMSEIKQFIDQQRNNIYPKTTIEALTTQNSGGNFLTTKEINGEVKIVDSEVAVDTVFRTVTVGTTQTGESGTNAEVTNSGTGANAILDFVIPRGNDGHNPNLGSFTNVADAPTSGIITGDYITVIDNSDPSNVTGVIYTWNQGWQSTGRDANMAYFSSGQLISDVAIINDLATGGVNDVLSAEQGMLLNKKLYGYIDMSQQSEEITLNNYLSGGVIAARGFQNSETEAWRSGGNIRCGYISHEDMSNLLEIGYTELKVTMPTAYQGRITFVKKIPSDSLTTKTYQELVDGGYLCDVHNSYSNVCLICSPNSETIFTIPEDAYAVFFQYRSNDDGASASSTLRKPSSVKAVGVFVNGDIQELEKGIPDNSIGTSKIMDGAITGDKLSDDAIKSKLTQSVETMKSYNLIDYTKTTKNKLNTNGEPVSTSSDVALTDYIMVPQNGLVADNPTGASSSGNPSWATYDENFVKVSVGYTNGKMYLPYNAQYKYARFVLSNTTTHRIVVEATSDYSNIPNSLVGALQNNYYDEAHFEYSSLKERLNIDDCVPDVKPSMSLCGLPSTSVIESTLASDTPIYIDTFPKKLKNCFNYNFKVFFNQFESEHYIRIGNGRNATNGRTIEITPTKLSFLRYVAGNTNSYVTESSVSHGLTVSDFIIANIFADYNNVKVILTTGGGTFEHVFSLTVGYETYVNYGTPYALSNIQLTNVEFSAYSDRFALPIWVVGASYTSITEKRWTYQMIKTFGYDKFLIAGNPGDGSSVALQELERLLAFGTPKYLIWMIGINDTPFNYKTYAKRLEILCKQKGIELIYTRVPKRCNASNTSVTDDKAEINEYVVNSGYRYVSLYDAVINPSTGLWFDGMNDDGTHPTVKGAKAMAAQVILDFPEIASRK